MVSVICQQVAPRAVTAGVIRGRLYCAGRTSRRESVALFRRYITRVVVGVNVRITKHSIIFSDKLAEVIVLSFLLSPKRKLIRLELSIFSKQRNTVYHFIP